MSTYYKYAPNGTKTFDLYIFENCFYCYTYEAIVKWFVSTLGKILLMNLLGYAHWFMSIRISQMKDNSISVDQARYFTSIVAK